MDEVHDQIGVSSRETVSVNAPLEFAPGAGVARFFTNHAAANISLFEIRLIANFVDGVNPEDGKLVVRDSLFLSMSPEMAVFVRALLDRAIENYVRDYGNIRIPRSTQAIDEQNAGADQTAVEQK